MTRVKICGLTNLVDALAAAEAGADLLGFVLVPSSARYVAPQEAARIVSEVRRHGVSRPCVGVVAGLGLGQMRAILDGCGFDLVQLHGEVGPAVARALYPRAIVVRQVRGAESLVGLEDLPAYAYLLDARGAERRSVAPATWNWRLLAGTSLARRAIVAGGLTPQNVADAVRTARPWGVDVASGVEASPGRKDHLAMVRFVEAVREVNDDGN